MNKADPGELHLPSTSLEELLRATWMNPPDGESRYEVLVRLINNANLTFFIKSNSPPSEVVTSEVRSWADQVIALEKRMFLPLRRETKEAEEKVTERRFRREAAELAARLPIDLHEVRITGANARRARHAVDETLPTWPVDALVEDAHKLKSQLRYAKKAQRRASAKRGKRDLQLADARKKRAEPGRWLKKYAQQLKRTELQRNPGCSDLTIANTITPAVREEAKRRFPEKNLLKGSTPELTVYRWIHSKG